MRHNDDFTQVHHQLKITENRKHERFYLLDEEGWSFHVEGHQFPVTAIQDLNSVGMQIVVKNGVGPDIGEALSVHLALLDAELVRCNAVVKWTSPHPENPHAKLLGLQFIDPFSRIASVWQEREVKRHVGKQKLSDLPELEIVVPETPVRFDALEKRTRELHKPPYQRKRVQARTSFWGSIFGKLFN